MKKLVVAVVLCFGMAGVACAEAVAAVFPIYDWVREISRGSGLEVALLLDSGVDLHSFQPTVDDVVRIAECDMFIYVGGESDEWAEDILSSTHNTKRVVVSLLEVLGDVVRTEETVEGMQSDEEEPEPDEHVWLSLRNAEKVCRYLAEKLSEIDREHKELYMRNVSRYVERLSALDKQYQDTVDASARKTLLFADRFPFRYLVDDYGLKYYAAFSGCSAESEASFETVIFLAKKVDELELPCIMTIEGTNHRIAQTVKASTSAKNQKVLVMNSMQSTTSQEASYLDIMTRNLDVLREALN